MEDENIINDGEDLEVFNEEDEDPYLEVARENMRDIELREEAGRLAEHNE